MTNSAPPSYRILVVDDSEISLYTAERYLQDSGFQVMTANSGEDALTIMEQMGLPHLALVDINMPGGIDGFEFCDKMHQFCDVPVIMLTAVDEEDVIIQAIEEYAEDYIKKPVTPGELAARVRRVLYRLGDFAFPLESYTQADANLAVNFVRGEAIVRQETVMLTPTETKLLYLLMRTAGRLVTSNYLIRRLWPEDSPKSHEDRLRVYVHRLRNKIELSPTEPQYILSRRNKGYIFTYEGSKHE
ncbi:MAG TPA: response regulator transcription factor [Chloroflexota bacterium]|nr:response regulator transcription factor [Chloroflexota bacterium]HUM71287.1 response regulator transcription factor [Chloroflexota bacterium]